MTHIRDIMDYAELGDRLLRQDIRSQTHPEFNDLVILNYTEAFVFKREEWTPTMLAARGLIYNRETGEVLARPFAKFFNYGDTNAPEIDLNQPLYWAGNKEDGSLGIGYVRPDGKAAIATRGSFDSEQARHATGRLTLVQAMHIKGANKLGKTLLYEIVYPENRIVLNYGDVDKLFPLGRIKNKTGEYIHPLTLMNNRPQTLSDALLAGERFNKEGWVLWLDPFTAVKLKQEDYVALHKIVTNLSERSVWEAKRDGKFDEYAAQLPDEFHKWATRVAHDLEVKWSELLNEAEKFAALAMTMSMTSRRVQAEAIKFGPKRIQGLAFLYLDGRVAEAEAKAWKLVRP
ncbi:RNA ligase and tail fiber protein attachment catalyst [Clavibacter phage CN1A]|uniref:RNA ligase n=1 Tax=Clavibacter phage CN1A TaxID=1406793 RepID=U5PTC9_9CAUD|nr:RNA ligase and tail fiber protein attachment catalyst [Clavibacter phage CN1A]AGY47134.1 RNA ligase [Clavibacter phage CN1A]